MLLLRLCYDNHNIAAKKNGKPLRLPPGLERQEKTKRSVGDEKKISGRTKKLFTETFVFSSCSLASFSSIIPLLMLLLKVRVVAVINGDNMREEKKFLPTTGMRWSQIIIILH